jgi:hypothetical protein
MGLACARSSRPAANKNNIAIERMSNNFEKKGYLGKYGHSHVLSHLQKVWILFPVPGRRTER